MRPSSFVAQQVGQGLQGLPSPMSSPARPQVGGYAKLQPRQTVLLVGRSSACKTYGRDGTGARCRPVSCPSMARKHAAPSHTTLRPGWPPAQGFQTREAPTAHLAPPTSSTARSHGCSAAEGSAASAHQVACATTAGQLGPSGVLTCASHLGSHGRTSMRSPPRSIPRTNQTMPNPSHLLFRPARWRLCPCRSSTVRTRASRPGLSCSLEARLARSGAQAWAAHSSHTAGAAAGRSASPRLLHGRPKLARRASADASRPGVAR